MGEMRTKPTAVFMAFGTKGDVFPLAAVAADFGCDQEQYHVVFITHSVHESLSQNLLEKRVAYIPVSSPPTLSPVKDDDTAGLVADVYFDIAKSFSMEKRKITKEHMQECFSISERIFTDGLSLENDVVEGWSLAELYNIRCVVAAPYVVPYRARSSFERHFRNELPHLYKYLKEDPPTKICWDAVIHWMWPLFTEDWGSWRSDDLNLSPWPFTV